MGKRHLSAERLRGLLRYHPLTGVFIWLESNSNRVRIGDRAGCISNTTGYRYVGIDCHPWRASDLAWLYVTGDLPMGVIDHINRDRADDRFSNLRVATIRQNAANASRHKDNRSGFKGVEFHRQTGMWRGRICIDGLKHSLGLFKTPRDAHEAYCKAARLAFGEYATGGDNR